MSDGNSDMITQLNDNFTNPFNSIVLISGKTLQFNDLIPSFSTSALQNPFDQAANVIDSVNISSVLDFTSTVAINFLTSVSTKAYTLDPINCSPGNVNADSWTPSFDVIGCEAGSFKQPPCTDLSNTVICPVGCYEIFDELTSASGDSASYTTNLQTRYGTGCNYANYIINLHDNWNKPRMTYLDIVQNTIDSESAAVTNYDNAVKTIQASLNSFKSNLETNFNSETNLTSGSFNGVDCSVMGETIMEFRDSACVGILGSIQYNFIMLVIISYSILLLGCFSICTGVRHFYHFQKMQVKVGYKGVPISISSNRILDKFDK